MKKRLAASTNKPSHITYGSVLDDLGFTPAEALELKIKAEIYRDLLEYIREQGYGQQQLTVILGLHQPDVSNLLNGRVSKFSVSKLIKLAGKLNLGARIKLTKPKTTKATATQATTPQRRPVRA